MSKSKNNIERLNNTTKVELIRLAQKLNIEQPQKLKKSELIDRIINRDPDLKIEDFINLLSPNSVTEYAFKEYLALLRKNKTATIVGTIIILASIVSTLTYVNIKRQNEVEELRAENMQFDKQLKNLDEVNDNLKVLLDFVNDQKAEIIRKEENLKNLEQTRDKLKPVIEADQKIIENILELQNEKVRREIWKERLFGLIIGVVGSLIASLIFTYFAKRRKRIIELKIENQNLESQPLTVDDDGITPPS